MKLNEIFNSKSVDNLLNERSEIEKFENLITSIEEDGKNLERRFTDVNKCGKIILPDGIILKEPSRRKSGYSESETMVLLVQLTTIYPLIFTFKLLDYNTTDGIDFVAESNKNPKYIELKGTMNKNIKHPFRYIYKFIAYDINFSENDIVEDLEEFKAILKINKNDKFPSFDERFKDKQYVSYKLEPEAAAIQSMEIINLKTILTDLIRAKIE